MRLRARPPRRSHIEIFPYRNAIPSGGFVKGETTGSATTNDSRVGRVSAGQTEFCSTTRTEALDPGYLYTHTPAEFVDWSLATRWSFTHDGLLAQVGGEAGVTTYRPSPKSRWNHKPGSGTHGRCTRRFPASHALRAVATARRVVRSEPA